MFLHLVQRPFEFSCVQHLRPVFMISKTDCALQTASLPSRSCLLEAPLFVVDTRYMRCLLPILSVKYRSDPRGTTDLRYARNSSDSSSSRTTKCNLTSKGPTGQCMQPPTLALIVMRRTRPIIFASPDTKRQAPMMGSLGENVGMRTRQFVKHRNAHLQATVAKLGCG